MSAVPRSEIPVAPPPAARQAPAPHAPPARAAEDRDGPRIRRWTRDEYYKMAELGFFNSRRIVLLRGEIIEMPVQGNAHCVSLGKSERALRDAFPPTEFWVRSQQPLDLPDGSSEPEPDLAVVRGHLDEFTQHPSTALLVIEVADTSLRLDRRKAGAYASAGVPDYWIVNLPDHAVEVYRDPAPDATSEFGSRYATASTHRPGDVLSPLAAPHARVAVADLLPARPVGDTF